MKTNFLFLYGFGWSGSGAVLDFLKENKDVCISDTYFFLLRDYGGIIDLKNNLVNNWDVFRSSAAVKAFLRLCKRSKKRMLSLFSTSGRDYKKQFGKRFDSEIEAFIKTVTDYQYYCYEHSLNIDKNYFSLQKSRIIHQLDKKGIKLPISKNDLFYFGRPTEACFNSAVNRLVSNLYQLDNLSEKYLLIDHHPISIFDYSSMKSFFGQEAKMIVVDRDPRDIYCDLIDNRMRIGSEVFRSGDVSKYILWHKRTRSFVREKDVLFTSFEKMVFDYEKETQRILDYLGIEKESHVSKFSFFDPSISKNNVGIWKKKYPSRKREFDEIYKQLKEFCWDE